MSSKSVMGVFAKLKGLLLTGATLSLLISSFAAAAEPVLHTVRFEGQLPFSESKAMDIVSLRSGHLFDHDAANTAALKLRDACSRRHYPLAKVEWKAVPSTRSKIDLIYTVDLGRPGKLKVLRLSGNRRILDETLMQKLRVRPRSGLFNRLLSRDVVLLDDLAEDQRTLLNTYLQKGFGRAEIDAPQFDWVAALQGYRLTWSIDEGQIYQFAAVHFEAEELPPSSDLKQMIDLKAGEVYEKTRVERVIEKLKAYYRNQGYAFPDVHVQEEWLDDLAQVDLLFKAEPGGMYLLRNIRVTGNKKTDDHVILREIPIKKGERFHGKALELAQDNLSALPLFEDVTLNYTSTSDGYHFDLEVEVKERNTGRVEVGVVYGEAEGAAFQFSIQENNFSLSPPFYGAALQGKFGATLGSDIIRTDVKLRNPRLADSAWILDGAVRYEDSAAISDYYDQRTYGGSVLFNHPLGRYNMFTTGYSLTGYDIYDQDEDQVYEGLDVNQDLIVTSWVLAWSMNLTDREIRTTRGLRLTSSLSIGNRAFGGDVDIVESQISGSLFIPLIFDHVISLRGGVISMDPYGDTDEVDQSLRLYLGGSSNLRGFEYRSISSLNEAGYPVGGESAWWSTVEYRVPVLKWLDLALYYDVGDVSLDAHKFAGDGPVSNWGIGVLIQAEEFPVRFDFATPITTLDGDRKNEEGKAHFSFSAGFRF